MSKKRTEYCDRCGAPCDDPMEAFWWKDYHYCQDCYMKITGDYLREHGTLEASPEKDQN